MPTPINGTSAYAFISDLLARYDERVVRQLCTDSEYEPQKGDVLDASNPAGAKASAALADASGDIEAAALVGGRYTVADLAALVGNGLATLKRLTCVLAMDYLNQRRADPSYQVSLQVQQAKAFLDALSEGDRIFGLQEVVDAGTEETDVETAATVEARGLTTYTAQRFFGTRNNRR